MSYGQKASRATPVLVILILDDSGSMADLLSGTNDAKHKWVEYDLKAILHELMQRSTEIRDGVAVIKSRYYVSIIEYGSNPQFWGDPVMDIETAVRKFTDNGNSLGMGGRLGGTDSKAASTLAYEHLVKMVNDEKFKSSFPPIVVHITDGASRTSAKDIAEKIKQLSTDDGNVLMVNAYIGTQTSLNYNGPEDFPGYIDVSEVGSDQDNINLFEMSSVMPPCIEDNLKAMNIFPKIRPNSRLFFDVRTKAMLTNVIQVIGSIESRAAR